MTNPGDIATQICYNDSPSSTDGVSNRERFRFILKQLGLESLNLNAQMDYEKALETRETNVIDAAIHLAILQFQFFQALRHHNLCDQTYRDLRVAILDLTLHKLHWHKKHASQGIETPPFTFIH